MTTANPPAPPSPEHILQIGLGFWASRTLLSAVELGVFTQLAGKPQDLEALRSAVGLHARAARDFLDALTALGFLQRANRKYSNAPVSDFYLDKNKPTYIGGVLEMASSRLYGCWNRLTEGLRTGKHQNEIEHDEGGAAHFDSLYADPARLKTFLSAMTGVSRGANISIACKFPWKQYKTFVDVGPAQGDLAVQIARVNSHLTGTGFDLPQVKPIFEEYVAQNGLKDRLRFVSGNFFEEPLPKADVVTMGHILHDWNLEEKKMLLRKAYEAVPQGGAVVAYDAIIDDDRCKNAFGLMMSLNMLIETPGGFDYTGADCIGWMKEAGFREMHVEHLIGPDSMVVGTK
ncbi:MAG TPA: methyltransferase [Candidatus Acidoferrales bacterium]|nr:methyltransferase [Candidatus Acidoferrales bacterium]